MTTLVTGASGFVGAALVDALSRRGERVIGVDRAPPPGGVAPGHASFRHVAADLGRSDALDAICQAERVDRMIVAAAITADARRERRDPVSVVAVNVGAVADAVRAAAEHGIRRVLYVGSGAVYGDSAFGEDALVEDQTPLRPRSLYAITKQAGEAVALRLADSFGLDLTAVRLGTCFGPFERETGVRDTLSAPLQALRLARAGVPVRLPRPGLRDWLYVRDAVAGMLALVDEAGLPHRVYNVAAGFEWSLARWCAHLERAHPGLTWSVTGPASANVDLYDPADRAPMSIARLVADTPYRPRYDVAEAAEDFLSWTAADGT